MGLSESIPPALALTVGEAGGKLSLQGGPGTTPADFAWVTIEDLDLAIVGANGYPTGDAALERLKTRRLALRAATLGTAPAHLQASLDRCLHGDGGFADLRVWFGADAPWIGGRVTIGNREAPFTIRVALEPRATGTRRLRVFLGDVRLFAPLPLPAPLVGAALARAILAGCGGRTADLGAQQGAVDLAPLDLLLVPALVAWGWRMPDLAAVSLQSVSTHAGELRLAFDTEAAPLASEAGSPDGAASPSSWLEGERLPPALAEAEEKLFAGDVRAAELAYRRLLASRPDDRATQARLVALCAATGTSELEDRAHALTTQWPDFVPGWLFAALGAWSVDHRETAAALFLQAAELAAARGEAEDARLAREAASAARARPATAAISAAPAAAESPAIAIARALARGDRATADALIANRLAGTTDPLGRGALYAEIADAIVSAGGEAALALGTLRDVSLGASSDRGLDLRVELSERLGDAAETERALGELITRAVATGDMTRARALSERHARLAIALATEAIPRPTDAMDSGNVTGRTESVYATEADPQARSGALGALLRGFDQLAPDRQRAAYASFGRVAESTGDLERAEEAYWRGTHVDGQPAQRAEFLASHARLLLSRGNDRAAVADLDEALRIAPDHARVMAARADLAFRAHDRERARDLYARLDRLSDAAEIVPRETLVHRRAVLARAADDLAEAETCYRELAILEPRQIEARQALADLAQARGDLGAAAQRLEEVLRLLPLDALNGMLEVRERLGELYARLGDWGGARYYLELIVAHDGGRSPALERLVDVYERLGLFEEAASACERLSRLYLQPLKRAAVIFRQGELFLEALGDEPRAFNAFLKSSDLAPTFVPTALRLTAAFWARGRFDDVADLADELGPTGALAQAPLPARLRLAMSVAIARRDPARGRAAIAIDDAAAQPGEIALALAEAGHRLAAKHPRHLEPAVSMFYPAGEPDESDALTAPLAAMLRDDPAASAGGAAAALAWLADRRGDSATARPLFALAAFLHDPLDAPADAPDGGAAGRLGELGLCPVATTELLALGGVFDHPDVGGAAAPLRRALAALAHGLAGFGPLGSRPTTIGELALGTARRDGLYALAKTMAAPPLGLALTEGDVPPRDISVLATRPAIVTLTPAMLEFPDEELAFLTARAIDRLRSGLALIEAVTAGTVEDVDAVLQGASAALDEATTSTPELPLAAIAVAAELASADRAAALVGQAPRARVVDDMRSARQSLSDWSRFQEAAMQASDRFALIACRSPLAALRALHRMDAVDAPDSDDLSARERKTSFLRTSRLRALVSFMTSAGYADATRDLARA
ncbi:MAG TPA: hypothetical protein VGP07_16845 [Polyangia bacterium]|jgi:tetratricopeptide (TPR) repeat protein